MRPWNPPSSAIIRLFPGVARRVNFTAASVASVPVLQKKTFGKPESWTSFSARRPCAGW